MIAGVMRYVFGPVFSRRLGQSLGVDPIPQKTCNWNCVYCQLGRTTPMTDEIAEWIPAGEIVDEIEAAVAGAGPGGVDWVTFVGSGEPTLHGGLGSMICEVQKRTGLPVAVITNGSLLWRPEVRRALAAADAVLPSLDAGSAELYRRINRPHPDITFERHIEGLITFSQEYDGRLWIETVLIEGLNDTEEALRDLAGILERIQPDEVHVNIPNRPPAETWVRPAGEEGLLRAAAILGDVARIVHGASGTHNLGGYDNVVEAILDIISRHPMREDELLLTLEKYFPGQAEKALEELRESGRAHLVERYGTRFWSGSESFYPAQPDDA